VREEEVMGPTRGLAERLQREEVVRLRVFHDDQPAVDQLCS
jgi:hypothetical protein